VSKLDKKNLLKQLDSNQSRLSRKTNNHDMKMKLKTLTASSIVLAAISQVYGQYTPPPPPVPFPGFLNEALRKDNPYMNKWDIAGNDRLRYEVKQGFAIPGKPNSVDFLKSGADTDNEYLLNKLRFHVGYTDKWWSAYVEGRSSIALNDERFAYFGGPTPPPGTVNRNAEGPEQDSIDLHQAYVSIGDHKEFPLSTKVGRQELSYGDERLVGAFGWNNIGRVFDAAKLRWQNPWFGVDFFTARPVIPVDSHFNESNDYDWFSGAYANSTKIPKHILEAYFFSRNASRSAIHAVKSPQFPQPTARDVYTVGARLKSLPGQLGNWDYTLEAAYQFGDFATNATSMRLDHQAYMVDAQGGYTFADCWSTPRLGMEYMLASGDSNPGDGKHETFDALYPTKHKFLGYMDFISLQNVHDIRTILQAKPTPRMSVALEGHGFWLADTHDFFYNAGGAGRTTGGYGIHSGNSSFVGTELDVVAGYAVTKFAQIEAGYGHFFRGKYVDQSLASGAGSRDANYLYIQTTVSF
jgi:hypothetical protein